ncbi:HPr kinase/phosphorylase [Rhodosalinus sp. K401]|uniref:HPr kinase/phosphorylase n=1 Tax=Rhodosalinus sp. K401 TaxID=3239195 RepID=UPI0035269687
MPDAARPSQIAGEASPDPHPEEAVLHAACIALQGRAALVLGRSGAGKSRLALECLARGALLVADDRVVVRRAGPHIVADAPPALRGLVEARGVGLLHARAAGPTLLGLLVDLDRTETARLPPLRRRDLLGVSLPVVHNSAAGHFPAAILQYLTCGRFA